MECPPLMLLFFAIALTVYHLQILFKVNEGTRRVLEKGTALIAAKMLNHSTDRVGKFALANVDMHVANRVDIKRI
jgi:hypothetical protein